MSWAHELTFQRFGKLTVIGKMVERVGGAVKWLCTCDCGNVLTIRTSNLLRNQKECMSCCSTILKREENREEFMLGVLYRDRIVKRHDKKSKVNCISFEEFKELINSPCIYCGIICENSFKDRETETVVKHNGVDRINSSLGYAKDNCVPCCGKCNRAKYTGTKEELLEHVRRIYEFNKLGE